MDKGTQAGQCEKARRNCFPARGQAVYSHFGHHALRGLKLGLHTPNFSGYYCYRYHFCFSGLNTGRTFQGFWGLLGKLLVPREFDCALTPCSRIYLMSRVTANGRHFLLTGRKMESSCMTSPKVFVVSNAVINLDCKISQYFMFICVKATIAK